MADGNGYSWGWYIFIFIIFIIILIVLGLNIYYWGLVSGDTTTNTSDVVNTCGVTSSTANFLYWFHVVILVLFIIVIVLAVLYWAFSGDDEEVEYMAPLNNVLATQTAAGTVNTKLDFVGSGVDGNNVYRAAGSTINTPADIRVDVQSRQPIHLSM